MPTTLRPSRLIRLICIKHRVCLFLLILPPSLDDSSLFGVLYILRACSPGITVPAYGQGLVIVPVLSDDMLGICLAGGSQNQPTEEVLWSYMVQLTSAARATHSAGLLLRPQSLMPCKVIITSPRRIRVGMQLQISLAACLMASPSERHSLVAAVTQRGVACLYPTIHQGSVQRMR